MANQRGRINLRSVNLNLLPILESLLTTRSVTETATRLHMSQSAVSDALARLRVQFGDELLIRSGRGMLPTPVAQNLLTSVRDVVARIEAMVQTPTFDPAKLEREFVIATADPVIMTLGGALCELVCERAPRASVRFIDLHRHDYDRLRSMELDLVIVPQGFIRRQGLHHAHVYEEIFVCIARRNHPEIRKRITSSLYTSLPHVSFRTDEGASHGMEAQLIGLEQHDVIKVPSFSLLPFIVEQTNAIALVQKRVAERFSQTADITIYDAPVPIPPLDVCMYWARGHHQDREHQWLRERLISIAN